MATFNFADVTKVLESTNIIDGKQKGISFENENLKLDTVHDGKHYIHVRKILTFNDVLLF